MDNLQALIAKLAEIESVSSVETAPLSAERAEQVGTAEGLAFACLFPAPGDRVARSEIYLATAMYEAPENHDAIVEAVKQNMLSVLQKYEATP